MLHRLVTVTSSPVGRDGVLEVVPLAAVNNLATVGVGAVTNVVQERLDTWVNILPKIWSNEQSRKWPKNQSFGKVH